MSDRLCPICLATPQCVDRIELRSEFEVLCHRCGLFRIAALRAETLPELIRAHGYAAAGDALRAHIRKRNVTGEVPIVDSLFIDDAWSPQPSD